jgi:hypothetical protein
MKHSSSPSRVRWFCRAVRQWGSGESSHVATCADCREFFAAAGALESALRRDVAGAAAAPDDGLERRILHAVRRAGAESAPGRTRTWNQSGFWVAGAAAAALAVAWVAFQRGSREVESAENSVVVTVTKDDAEALVATVNSLSGQLVDSVIPSAVAMVADNPLQREVDSIYAEARSALGFLALNFLPTAPANMPPRSG